MTDRYRTGRKVGRTIYRAVGDEPSDDDVLVGMLDTPELAADFVAAVNARPTPMEASEMTETTMTRDDALAVLAGALPAKEEWGIETVAVPVAAIRAVVGDPPSAPIRRFELHRHEDVSGVSGDGVVAQGVEFSDGLVALRWLTEWPTSVVFHDRGAAAVEHVHGHNGRTEVVWFDA